MVLDFLASVAGAAAPTRLVLTSGATTWNQRGKESNKNLKKKNLFGLIEEEAKDDDDGNDDQGLSQRAAL